MCVWSSVILSDRDIDITRWPYMIGVVGPNGSGKSVCCDYLARCGYDVFSLSDSVRAEARLRKRPLTRDNLILTGNELKTQFGTTVLAERVFDSAQALSSKRLVFDSIRHPDEALFLKGKGVCLLGVTAPIEVRYQRIMLRKKETDRVSFEQFKEHDIVEASGNSIGQHILKTLELCDNLIENEQGLTDFEVKLQSILSYESSF